MTFYDAEGASFEDPTEDEVKEGRYSLGALDMTQYRAFIRTNLFNGDTPLIGKKGRIPVNTGTVVPEWVPKRDESGHPVTNAEGRTILVKNDAPSRTIGRGEEEMMHEAGLKAAAKEIGKSIGRPLTLKVEAGKPQENGKTILRMVLTDTRQFDELTEAKRDYGRIKGLVSRLSGSVEDKEKAVADNPESEVAKAELAEAKAKLDTNAAKLGEALKVLQAIGITVNGQGEFVLVQGWKMGPDGKTPYKPAATKAQGASK